MDSIIGGRARPRPRRHDASSGERPDMRTSAGGSRQFTPAASNRMCRAMHVVAVAAVVLMLRLGLPARSHVRIAVRSKRSLGAPCATASRDRRPGGRRVIESFLRSPRADVSALHESSRAPDVREHVTLSFRSAGSRARATGGPDRRGLRLAFDGSARRGRGRAVDAVTRGPAGRRCSPRTCPSRSRRHRRRRGHRDSRSAFAIVFEGSQRA